MFGIQSDGTPGAIPLDKDLEQGLESMSFVDSLKGLGFEDAVSKIAHSLINFGFKLFVAILVFYLGRFVIKKIFKLVFKTMTSRQVDASLTTFVLSLVKITLYFILIITVIGILGIETSSFIAIFASAGVALGMALSGTLQNFAGGVLILLLKPYKVGDFIEVQGFTGTVKSIQLFNTVINTIDNKAIIIPNGSLSTSSINNYSLEQYRRVDWNISLSYGTDFDSVRTEILEILKSDDRVVLQYIEDDMKYRREEAAREKKLEATEAAIEKPGLWKRMFRRRNKIKAVVNANYDMPVMVPVENIDRSPDVFLSEMADSAIVVSVRAWTHSSNYWPLFFCMNERFYKELPEKGFSFPFPQLDVHLDHQN